MCFDNTGLGPRISLLEQISREQISRGPEDTAPTNAAALTGLIHDHQVAIQGLLILDHQTRDLTDDGRRIVTNSGAVPTVSGFTMISISEIRTVK